MARKSKVNRAKIEALVSRLIMEAAAKSEEAWKKSGWFIGKRDGDYIIRRLERGIREMKKLR